MSRGAAELRDRTPRRAPLTAVIDNTTLESKFDYFWTSPPPSMIASSCAGVGPPRCSDGTRSVATLAH